MVDVARVCAWCTKPLGSSPPGGNAGRPITHGICDECVRFVWSNEPRSVAEFIQSLDLPVLLVDAAGRARGANSAAAGMLGKTPEQIEGRLGGDVMECARARLPGGCGKTELCAVCVIRNAVTATHRTGAPVEGVAAPMRLNVDGRERSMLFRISTERIADVVCLRVDEAAPGQPD